MSTTSSENHEFEYDPIAEYVIQNILGPSLGIKIGARWLDKAFNKDVIALTPENLEDMIFPKGNCSLWKVFKEYMEDKASHEIFVMFEAPKDFWLSLSAESFKEYRIEYIESEHSNQFQPNPRERIFLLLYYKYSYSTKCNRKSSKRSQDEYHWCLHNVDNPIPGQIDPNHQPDYEESTENHRLP